MTDALSSVKQCLRVSNGLCLTPRSADAALPRANVGGISAKNRSPAKFLDKHAVPLTQIVGRGGCGKGKVLVVLA